MESMIRPVKHVALLVKYAYVRSPNSKKQETQTSDEYSFSFLNV